MVYFTSHINNFRTCVKVTELLEHDNLTTKCNFLIIVNIIMRRSQRSKRQLLPFSTRINVPFELQPVIDKLLVAKEISDEGIDISQLNKVLSLVTNLFTILPDSEVALNQMRKVLGKQEYFADCLM